MYRFAICLPSLLLLAVLAPCAPVARAQTPVERAWQELPHYEYGQDLAGQLAIERSVIESMNDPAARAALAARFAQLLRAPTTTPAARQFICLQLRQVGTPAEIPVLAELLQAPDTCQMALYAIAAIPGREALETLRAALDHLQGDALAGVIHALGARRDAASVERLIELAEGADASARPAAIRALAEIADPRAIDWFRQRLATAQRPLSTELASCLLRAEAVAAADRPDDAPAALPALPLAEQLADEHEQPGTRRAALELSLKGLPEGSADTICRWLQSDDPIHQQVAAAHLSSLPDETLKELSGRLDQLPEASSIALIEVLAGRQHKSLMPLLQEMVHSDNRAMRVAGLRYLGALRDPSAVATLVDQLSSDELTAAAALHALTRLPRDIVGPALLAALERPDIRKPVIAALRELRYYEAIDPLIAIARDSDPDVYGLALDGLRGIADPDDTDLPRLMGLLFQTQPGAHRDEVEKTIAVVCDRLPAGEDRAEKVLQLLADADDARKVLCLPLLGRLGGDRARRTIEPYLEARDRNVREAAVRAICNWPNAEVADQLLALATSAGDKRYARWALRAYVRVVSLPSDRPPQETLAMLQTIMRQAQETEDRTLILSRAATVRTMECVQWVAGYLDDAALAQAACAALVDLAHHRELRHPNMDQFGPILDKVAATSQDASVVQRAKRYRLGL